MKCINLKFCVCENRLLIMLRTMVELLSQFIQAPWWFPFLCKPDKNSASRQILWNLRTKSQCHTSGLIVLDKCRKLQLKFVGAFIHNYMCGCTTCPTCSCSDVHSCLGLHLHQSWQNSLKLFSIYFKDHNTLI